MRSYNFCHTNTKNPGNNLGIFCLITGRPKLNGYERAGLVEPLEASTERADIVEPLEASPERAGLVEPDGHGVQQIRHQDVEELYEHGDDVGARDGRRVADLLLGELTRGDRAQADGLAEPLAVEPAVLQMALNYFVSDRHNC